MYGKITGSVAGRLRVGYGEVTGKARGSYGEGCGRYGKVTGGCRKVVGKGPGRLRRFRARLQKAWREVTEKVALYGGGCGKAICIGLLRERHAVAGTATGKRVREGYGDGKVTGKVAVQGSSRKTALFRKTRELGPWRSMFFGGLLVWIFWVFF